MAEDQAPAVEAPAVEVPPPKKKKVKKTQVKGQDSSAGKPKYRDMVIDAITTQKERAGSSLIAIKNHLCSKYKVDVAQKAGALNRVLKKMREEGGLVAGAQPGRKGAGCFKISPEEKKGYLLLAHSLAGRGQAASRFHPRRRLAWLVPKRLLPRNLRLSKSKVWVRPAPKLQGRWPRQVLERKQLQLQKLVRRSRAKKLLLLPRNLRPSPTRVCLGRQKLARVSRRLHPRLPRARLRRSR